VRPLLAYAPDQCLLPKQHTRMSEALSALIFAFFGGLTGHARTEDVIVSQYQGRGWDDSTERDLNNELVRSNLFGH
jgi:hypothetical protein